MAIYIIDPAAHAELREIWQFIAMDNPGAAVRVMTAAFDSFQILADSPNLGRKSDIKRAKTKGMRSWRVSGFERYQIFYRPIPDGVQIIHIFHDARDIMALFDKK